MAIYIWIPYLHHATLIRTLSSLQILYPKPLTGFQTLGKCWIFPATRYALSKRYDKIDLWVNDTLLSVTNTVAYFTIY